MNGGRLTVEREGKAWTDRARAYKVMVDGSEAGRVRNGETATFDVAPGEHEVWMAIDWTRSRRIRVVVPPDGEVRLRCRGNASPWTIFWHMTMRANDYIALEQVAA